MISFILPVYNCYDALKNSLPSLINILEAAGDSYEIIIVDDGSKIKKDISHLLNEHCRILSNNQNFGKGYSVKKGVLNAAGDNIIFMDGDFPFDQSVIKLACVEISKNDIDVMIGDRSLLHSSDKHAGLLRSIGSDIFSRMMRNFFLKNFEDTQCGIKGFKKDVAKDIFSVVTLKGFAFDVELLYIALKRKYTIKKIPVTVNKQLTSTVKIIFHGIEMIGSLLKIKLNDKRGKYNLGFIKK